MTLFLYNPKKDASHSLGLIVLAFFLAICLGFVCIGHLEYSITDSIPGTGNCSWKKKIDRKLFFCCYIESYRYWTVVNVLAVLVSNFSNAMSSHAIRYINVILSVALEFRALSSCVSGHRDSCFVDRSQVRERWKVERQAFCRPTIVYISSTYQNPWRLVENIIIMISNLRFSGW